MLELLTNNFYVPTALVLGLLVLAYKTLGPRFLGDDPLEKLLGEGYKRGKVEKAIAQMRKDQNFLGAGRYLEELGRLPEAAEVYLEGQELYASGAVNEKLGRHEKAAELFLQAGDFKKAANLFSLAGKPGRAAVLFEEKGNSLEAARLYSLAGDFERCAALYVRAGYPLRAGEAFEKRGDFLKAAEQYEKHFNENVSYATGFSSGTPSADQKSAQIAGRLWEKAGNLARAAAIYAKGGYFSDAGRASLALGQPGRAAEFYLRAEDAASAAAAYEQAGDVVKAATLRGEVAFKQDKIPEAASWFVKGRDYLRAAELFESVGLLSEAAQAFEAGESHAAAGGVYVRSGDKARAATAYERAGDYETAAQLYEESGNETKAAELFERAGFTFKSGEVAARAGQRDKAIALLQRVGGSDENFGAATEILARLFLEGGMPGLAVERVSRALGGQPVNPGNIDLHYWYALALEASGRTPEALDAYRRILAEDLAFRDVPKRVAQLGAGGPSVPLPIAAPPGASAAQHEKAPAAASTPLPKAAPSPAPQTRAPRFEQKEEIGRGRLGVVVRAEDVNDGRSVALRILPPQALAAEGALQALVADLRAAAQVSHPNVVKVLGLVEFGGQRCVVSELVAGRNFAEALATGRRLSFQQVHGLGRVIAQALVAIHGRSLVHGSVQPSNIIVAQGVIKLADLGLGRLLQGPNTPSDYRPPEGGFDVHADLYALAAVLYHLLTGTHPKAQPQGVGLPLPSSLAPGVPEALDKLLLRSLHPRRELRFESAEDILRELREMVKIG